MNAIDYVRVSTAAADDLRLEMDPAERDILSRIGELKAAGHTTRQIADELNRQGFPMRRGTAWRFQYGGSTPGRIGFVGFEGTA
jgi:hypothetical protein